MRKMTVSNSFLFLKPVTIQSRDLNTFLFYLGIWIGCYLLNMLSIYPIIFYKTVFFLLFSINGLLIINSVKEKNPIGLMLFGYITLYMFPYINVLNKNVYLSIFLKEKDFQLMTKTLLIYSLFLLPFLLFRNKKIIHEVNVQTEKNEVLFFLLIVVFFILWHFGLRGQNILISGGYGKGESKKSSIYEYLLIVLFLIYKYSGKDKKKLLFLYFCCILYAGKNLIFGGRIETLMLLIMMYLLIFQKKLSFRVLIILVGLFYYLMQVFSNIRGNIKAIATRDYITIFNIFNSSSSLDYLSSNEGDVFWAGERILYLIRDGYLTIVDRFFSLISFFLSVFLPRSWLGGYDNLGTFKRSIYGTGGGGLAPLFFYAMFSLLGVFLIGYIIAILYNGITKQTSYKNLYILFMLVTLPRWFAYYPIHLIKFNLIVLFVVWFFSRLSSFIHKYFVCYVYVQKENI